MREVREREKIPDLQRVTEANLAIRGVRTDQAVVHFVHEVAILRSRTQSTKQTKKLSSSGVFSTVCSSPSTTVRMNSSSVVSDRIAAFAVATAKFASSRLRVNRCDRRLPVARVGARETRGVGAELLNGVVDGEEVAGGLGHLLVVQLDVSVAEERARHLRAVRPDRLVDVQRHHEVVLDQVFAAHADVERIPILELVAQLLQLGLLDSALCRVLLGMSADRRNAQRRRRYSRRLPASFGRRECPADRPSRRRDRPAADGRSCSTPCRSSSPTATRSRTARPTEATPHRLSSPATRVPRPNCREHAQLLSHSQDASSATLVFGLYVSRWFRM